MSTIEAPPEPCSPIRSELRSPRLDAELTAQQKRKLLAELLEKKARRSRTFPLSLTQQPLWFLDQLAPGRPTYHMQSGFRLEGPLDVAALQRAFGEISRRHEVLRATLPMIDGQPRQVIAPPSPFDLPIVDLADLPEDQREVEVRRLAVEEAHRPCDLERGPLWRARLVRLGPHQHVLFVMMHHIISDGWSLGVLGREIATLYEAFSAARASPLPELPLQYTDYAAWQRQRFEGRELEKHLAYWRGKLAGHPPALELPTDRPRPAMQTYRGSHHKIYLPDELVAAAKAMGVREGATLFMTLLAAFKTLLARYARQDDVLVGSPIANRPRPELEPLIGYFANMLVLRTDLSGNPTFRELLGRVRETAVGAYSHQELPLETLVQELQPKRDPSRHPLFQVMFVLQPGRNRQSSTMGGLKRTPLKAGSGASKFDLQMAMGPRPEGFRVSLGYNTDLFNSDTAARILKHYRTLLEAAVADPGRRLADLPLMEPAERRRVVSGFNNTAAAYSRDACIHELFESQAQRTPNAPAVVQGDRRLTYRDLNHRANQLAHYLRQLGVGPDSLVAIRVERSIDMVVGLLGILKAGGGYLPLDPLLPADRLQFMLEDARAPVLLTQASLLDDLPENEAHVVCLDAQWEEISPPIGGTSECPTEWVAAENPAPASTPENLAYMIYTSGSTGRSKGVMIEHRALVNYTQAVVAEYDVTAADRILQFASISFDAHAEEVFPCLTQGATLVLRTDAMLDSYEGFLRACEQSRLTLVTLPTAYWHELTAAIESECLTLPSTLRLMIIGGEKALPERVAAWIERIGGPRLLNTYGPTEATVVATVARPFGGTSKCPTDGRDVSTEPDVAPPPVPIGYPLRNVRTYVLDTSLEPVAIGVPGELYIGGEGLARGYLNRPELSAERFLPDPLADRPGSRMYRTGDLVRWRADGQLEFLGRTDQQVKIRGYRIEPGEVEAVLNEHPELREAVIVAREETPGETRLVAYVVPGSQPAPSIAELRGFLAQRLPSYMVPSGFMALGSLPMTASGKVDRRALPAPEPTRSDLHGQYVAPRTATEERLAAVWAEVLKVERVGVHDNFFELGGHSLLAVQVVSRVRQAFSVDLPLAGLFASPTVAELAQRVEAAQAAESPSSLTRADVEELIGIRRRAGATSGSPLVPLRPAGSRRAFFCVHGLLGHVLSLGHLAGAVDSDRPFYGLQARGLDGQGEAIDRVEDMAAFYIEAIRTLQPEGPYFLGGESMGGLVALEMAQQLTQRGENVALVAMLDTHPYDPDSPATSPERGIARGLAVQLGIPASELTSLPPDDLWARILERAKEVNFILPGVGPEDLQRLNEVRKAHQRAFQTYQPRAYPHRVVYFRAQDASNKTRNPEAFWRKLCGGLEIQKVPGNHATMIKEPHVRVLGEHLSNRLAQAEAACQGGRRS